MKKLTLAALVFIGIVQTACNTVEGVGEDVQSVGETVEDTAN